MTEEKTCYNCGNKNCHIFYSTVKQDVAEHHETYEYTEFDCVNHDKWKELKVEEIRTDNTETLKNAKKMTKDEIKNRISMALTNPVLQQGFEIICKQNIELGKHNEELIALINAERGRQEKCDDVHLRKIAELEKENADLQKQITELKSIAEFQQSSNMTAHFENKKLKEGLAVGSTWNNALNAMNKSLEEERDKYRNMVFDKMERLTEAKEIINNCVHELQNILLHKIRNKERIASILDKTEQFLKEVSE